ncbi:MAG: ImmA/IrrE family metallo-endopeptidase [Xanthomonadales bacterium]|nr:ImmA/IrrE family metallo-endopeptidase [Xanthomonadales bacterium]
MNVNAPGYRPHPGLIEDRARFTQLELWNCRAKHWGTDQIDPLDALEPGVALRMNGFQIETVSTLGEMTSNGKLVQVAGLIHRGDRIVQIASSRFSQVEQRFTAAHELGHAILHPNGALLHRDRPADTTGWQKDPTEREADFFAACFLMPGRQVHRWFRKFFLTDRFVLNDDTAFALCTKPLDSVLQRIRSHRDLSLTLARTISYNGQQFKSLSELFRVSPTAMACRLEELGLAFDPRASHRA